MICLDVEYFEIKSLFNFLPSKLYSFKLITGCTYMGKVGNGRERGTCGENFLCHSNGNCKPVCTIMGGYGQGINLGSCNEGQICFSDGSCRVSGTQSRILA